LEPWDATPGRRTFLGGDLDGIVSKLDHIASLSVDALYLTPIFTSPSNHRYDTSDYFTVDPDLGGNPALRRLVSALHERGMRLLLDGVFNHSGADWPPFVDVLQRGASSPHARWFYLDPAECGADSTTAARPGGPGYETWSLNVPTLPKLRTSEPDLRDLICRIGRFWVQEFGIDGWRLDVANEVDHRLWRAFRQQVRAADPEAFLVGEVWQAAMPWLRGDQFDSVMDYPLRDAILGYAGTRALDAPAFLDAVNRQRVAYPEPNLHFLYNLLGSHDVERALTACAGDRGAFTVATALLFGLPGIASIYYGDEVGMEGGDDPHNRGGMLWDERQDARLLDIHKRLGWLRRAHPALRSGTYERADDDGTVGDGTAAAFLRRAGSQSVAVIANPGPAAVRFPLHEVRQRMASPGRLLDTFGYGQEPATLARDSIHLPPATVVYLASKEHE
jgi:glycosidase